MLMDMMMMIITYIMQLLSGTVLTASHGLSNLILSYSVRKVTSLSRSHIYLTILFQAASFLPLQYVIFKKEKSFLLQSFLVRTRTF